MMKTGWTILIACLVISANGMAQVGPVASLEAAKEQARTRRQPILIEFTTDDCGDCAAAIQAAASDEDVQGALAGVAFYRVNVKTAEGKALVDKYDIGIRLPAYVFTDSEGREITQWTSYLAPQPWLKKIGQAQQDVTTLEDRLARMNQAPTFQDAAVLANYYLSVGKASDAVRFFRAADRLNTDSRRNYKYEIFHSLALAAWFGEAKFADVEKAADDVANSGYRMVINSVRVAHEIADLALRLGETERIGKYLNLAIQQLSSSDNDQYKKMRDAIQADYELFINHDTTKSLAAAIASTGPAFRRQVTDTYDYAIWCVERGINLDEAETLLKGIFESGEIRRLTKADEVHVASKIALARGHVKEAIRLAEEACKIDPVNPTLVRYLEDCRKAK